MTDLDGVKLAPCPFERGTCDEDALRVVVLRDPKNRVDTFMGYVECEDCGARGPKAWAVGAQETRDLAAYSWNDRALSPTPEAPGTGGAWKLVPVEPTEAMLDAYWRSTGESKEMRLRTHAYAARYYAAMIAATPAETQADEVGK